LNLPDAVQLVLDRILDGDDVLVGGVDPRQAGVERSGLPAAGRAGDQDDAVRLVNERIDELQLVADQAQLVELQDGGGAVEQTHDYALAVRGGHGRDADVHVLAGQLDADAAVLRQTLLGDVQPGHDLDARDDHRLEALGRRDDVVEDAVDAEAHRQVALERLDVDVAGAVLDRLEEERIDQLDDRRFFVGVEQILRFLELRRHQLEALFIE